MSASRPVHSRAWLLME